MIDSTYEDKLYQTPKFAGAVRYNAPKGCATRLCRACVDETVCVAVRYLTLRICGHMGALNVSCGRKNPLPFLYSLSSEQPLCSLRKGVIHKRVETLVSTLLCARAASAHVPALRRAQLPAEVQRKTPRPERANPLTQFVCPAPPVQKTSLVFKLNCFSDNATAKRHTQAETA